MLWICGAIKCWSLLKYHLNIEEEIIFYKIFKTDEDFNWLEEYETHSNTVDELLKEIDSFY